MLRAALRQAAAYAAPRMIRVVGSQPHINIKLTKPIVPILPLGFAAPMCALAEAAAASLHPLNAKAIDGSKLRLQTFEGKPLIIVNVASR